MLRAGKRVLGRWIVPSGCLAALFALGAGGCSDKPNETTAVQAPLVTGITDDAFRAAAGCADCTVTARSTVMLPLTGKVFTQVKLTSQSTHAPYSAALDGQGTPIDPRALLAAEGAAKIARQGKLRDDAYARSLTSSLDLVPISIWADFGDGHAPREQIISNSTLRASYQAQTKSRLQAVTSKVTSWLDARGFRTYERGIDSPVITADVPPSALAALGRLDGVAVVHLTNPDVPAGTVWFDAVKGPAAQMVVGSAVDQIFCNGEGGQPDDYTYLNPYQAFTSGATTDAHTRWTTELISATTGVSMAPDAHRNIADYLGTSFSKYTAWQWCYGNRYDNMNRSASTYASGVIGAPSGLLAEDMAQDYYAYHDPYPLITLSAGNCKSPFSPPNQLDACSSTSGNTSVGNRSYNTLIVGASDNHNSAATSDDTLADFSQYTNAQTTHGDFELPNLVAPGDDNLTTDRILSASVPSYYGTSGSSPIVLGTVLLMKQRDSNFKNWPEMMRATILTASTHPIDGARTDRLGTGVDRKQGAGLLNAAVAVNLADFNYIVSGPNNPGTSQGRLARYYDFSTDFPNSLSAPYNIVTWNSGRLRVVAAWDATAKQCNADGSGCQADVLDGDLDLRVSQWTGSSWLEVCDSTTWDSSWELCDVAVNAGEIYKAELVKYATNSPGTYVGIAWNNYDPNAE